MGRRLAVLGIGLACACGTLQSSPDDATTATTTSSDAGTDAAADAPRRDAGPADAAPPPPPTCDAAIYCEDFTNRASLADLGAVLAIADGGVMDLVGTLGKPDRALHTAGPVTPGMRAMAFVTLGVAPRRISLAYSLKVDVAADVNGPALIFPQSQAPDWIVYTYIGSGKLFVAEYQTSDSFHSEPIATLTLGDVHRIVLRVDLDDETAFTSIDGAPEVRIDLNVPTSVNGLRVAYGILSDWSDTYANVTYDDIVVASP